jgi:hypothetical protein
MHQDLGLAEPLGQTDRAATQATASSVFPASMASWDRLL